MLILTFSFPFQLQLNKCGLERKIPNNLNKLTDSIKKRITFTSNWNINIETVAFHSFHSFHWNIPCIGGFDCICDVPLTDY